MSSQNVGHTPFMASILGTIGSSRDEEVISGFLLAVLEVTLDLGRAVCFAPSLKMPLAFVVKS